MSEYEYVMLPQGRGMEYVSDKERIHELEQQIGTLRHRINDLEVRVKQLEGREGEVWFEARPWLVTGVRGDSLNSVLSLAQGEPNNLMRYDVTIHHTANFEPVVGELVNWDGDSLFFNRGQSVYIAPIIWQMQIG